MKFNYQDNDDYHEEFNVMIARIQRKARRDAIIRTFVREFVTAFIVGFIIAVPITIYFWNMKS